VVGQASLLEDGGSAASGPSFFRSPEFLEAEQVTHSLVVETGTARLAAPVVLNEVPGGGRDARSPYGYPGFAVRDGSRGLPVDPAEIEFDQTGLVSAFIRNQLGDEPPVAGPRARNICLLADPSLPPKSRMSDRQQIRKNERRGLQTLVVPGPEVSEARLDGFLSAYTETMERTEAAGHYFFSREYFQKLLSSPMAWLGLVEDEDGRVGAASLAVASDEMIHYFLSGTANEFLRQSPMKNLVQALVDFAGQRGLPLNLGGGLTPGDRLEEFKRGFANREEQWFTTELICDREAYAALTGDRESGDFFPAYRAP
jgi:hypothetical protein